MKALDEGEKESRKKLLSKKAFIGLLVFILLFFLPSAYWYSGVVEVPFFDKLAINFFVPATTTIISGVFLFLFTGIKDKLDEPSKIINFKETEKLAETGDRDAEFTLGVMYKNGTGVKQDDLKAFTWYHKAALQGHKIAQYNLGVMNKNGLGLPQNYVESYKWYLLAQKSGNGRARKQLKNLENKTKMTIDDIKEARERAEFFIKRYPKIVPNN